MSTRPTSLPQESTHSRLTVALDAGESARKIASQGLSVESVGASKIFSTNAPSGGSMMPRPVVTSARFQSKTSVVDDLINKLALGTNIRETRVSPEAPTSAAPGLSPDLSPDLWTSTTLSDGCTTGDHACYAYEGVFHPHPTASGRNSLSSPPRWATSISVLSRATSSSN